MIAISEKVAVATMGGTFWTGLGCGLGIAMSIAAPTPFTILGTIAVCGSAIYD